LIAFLTIVGTLVAFGSVPATAAGPTISVTPNKKLADGQQVLVSASGFDPNTDMAIVECPTSTISPDACDLNTVAVTFTDDTGAYTDVAYSVSRILSDGTDCATNGGCYIGTQDLFAEGASAGTLVKFDPNIPPLPPLEVSVRVDKSPKVNDKGVVQLRGTVQCRNRAAQVEIDLGLRQVYDRAIFSSFGFADVACEADSVVPWRATVRPENGIFGAGPAVVNFQAFAGNIFLFRRVAVDLQGRGQSRAHGSATPHLTWN
jgi:hypothetical protein